MCHRAWWLPGSWSGAMRRVAVPPSATGGVLVVRLSRTPEEPRGVLSGIACRTDILADWRGVACGWPPRGTLPSWKTSGEGGGGILSHLRTDHHKLVDWVQATETTLEELQPMHWALRVQVTHLSERVQVLESHAEDGEGRSRRNNIQIVGMPEGVEGTDAVTYLETWLHAIMDEHSITPFFALQRAHRGPTRRPDPGRPPRPIVAKLLHYRD
ncbi:hypothetical protein NDU88_004946 [Pleurodeles waltl]|uniref:Uncharacterized protein n=1 Tax=Pleurodeles waltl TaxID=8319 RepID=A0AAV7M8X9_PLEWA|nr:hypothetical protein NDU88_004946 [Pleurodeles waltl]